MKKEVMITRTECGFGVKAWHSVPETIEEEIYITTRNINFLEGYLKELEKQLKEANTTRTKNNIQFNIQQTKDQLFFEKHVLKEYKEKIA